jgi:hypothetical protein
MRNGLHVGQHFFMITKQEVKHFIMDVLYTKNPQSETEIALKVYGMTRKEIFRELVKESLTELMNENLIVKLTYKDDDIDKALIFRGNTKLLNLEELIAKQRIRLAQTGTRNV